jgi:TPR repeat protein
MNSSTRAMVRALVGFLCLCFSIHAQARLGETVPQLVERFGKSYTVEPIELGKKYKFRSAKVSVDAIVANGISICETYLSDHPLTASGEPPNDIVRAVLRTNVPKARWIEIEAAPLGANCALRSSDDKYIAILKYTGPQPENSVWIMTVGLAKLVWALSSISPPPPAPTAVAAPNPSPTAGLFDDLIPPSPSAHLSPPVSTATPAGDRNDAEVQFNRGTSYYLGQGVPKDYAEAVKWFRKAAEQNYAPAQSMLGTVFLSGEGVAKDYREAVKWLRKAAEQNDAVAQLNLGYCYDKGQGVAKNYVEAVKWYRKAAEQNLPWAQNNLGTCYGKGEGVAKDYAEAVKWYRKAAEQGFAPAQASLGGYYAVGRGAAKDDAEAVKWFRKAAEQNDGRAQFSLGACYYNGQGVTKDYVEGYKWWLLAAAQGNERASNGITMLEGLMSRDQIAEGQRLARDFKPREVPPAGVSMSDTAILQTRPESSGSGFFITDDGFLVTNEHVVKDAVQIRLVTSGGLIPARVVKVDSANDLALLKAEGKFAALPVASSRSVRLGSTVATVGFPNIVLQGFAPKLAKGEIAALSGPEDDARFFQISAPIQPGNSGGALVDEHGNVVGVVSAKLSARATLFASGSLPENVNYAVKSSFLLSFLESVPDVAAKLKEPNAKDTKFDDVVEQAKEAAALVVVY